MWWDPPFSQRNKTTERTVGVGVGDDREGGGSVTSRPKMMSVNVSKNDQERIFYEFLN